MPERTLDEQTGLTRSQRSMRAAIAAHERWAAEDPSANAARGQVGLMARFEREARGAKPGLTDAEYARRAESARKAHMQRVRLARSKARKTPREAEVSELAEHIKRVVDAAPPLSGEDAARLRALLPLPAPVAGSAADA